MFPHVPCAPRGPACGGCTYTAGACPHPSFRILSNQLQARSSSPNNTRPSTRGSLPQTRTLPAQYQLSPPLGKVTDVTAPSGLQNTHRLASPAPLPSDRGCSLQTLQVWKLLPPLTTSLPGRVPPPVSGPFPRGRALGPRRRGSHGREAELTLAAPPWAQAEDRPPLGWSPWRHLAKWVPPGFSPHSHHLPLGNP